jgi:hypothetical protein
MRKKMLFAGILAAVAAVAGGAIALGAGRDSEGGVTGPEADRAIRAALEATGGGTATAVERDNEDGAMWEVEVSTDRGTFDVRLDEQYRLVVIEGDREADGDEGRD